jgi:pimeloyl-ACP methyl ester carboxylesterase
MISYKRATVDGNRIFIAKRARRVPQHSPAASVPTSSHMFRNLIPVLADRYHVVAPDLPGFGFSDAPNRNQFRYTFENLAKIITSFTETIGLKDYAIYVFDYGAPVGLRLAIAHPERITAIISQNGNAYEEGLAKAGTRSRNTGKSRRQRTDGPARIPQAGRRAAIPSRLLDKSGAGGLRTRLRVASPTGQRRNPAGPVPGLCEQRRALSQVPGVFPQHAASLAVWGKNDPFFLPPGAEAFKRDNPWAAVRFYDTGHFALETHYPEIAGAIRDSCGRKLAPQVRAA